MDSARQYAEKLTKRTGVTHTVHITGHNNDGIYAIVVCDICNLHVINKYTTISTKYPRRLEYYTNCDLSSDESRVNKKGERLPESLQEWRHQYVMLLGLYTFDRNLTQH